jgi:hypothetical protein
VRVWASPPIHDLREIWVDGGYRQQTVEHGTTLGIDAEIVRRDPTTRGFTVLPRHRTVDRIFGRLMDFRRLTPDYETLPSRCAALIHLAMTDLFCRRLTQQLGASATSANHRDQMPTIAKSRTHADTASGEGAN